MRRNANGNGAVVCLLALLGLWCSPVTAQVTSFPVAGGRAAELDALGQQQHSARVHFNQGLDAWEQGELALAERLWLPAARAGDPQAAYHLALLYDRQAPGSMAAVIWYRRAARRGHVDAQHNLALAFLRGEGVPVDIRQAVYWWTRAAYQGNVDSQYNLGLVYALGRRGVPADRVRARFWWLRAARDGDAAAQYNLATLYANDPTRPDWCQARRWFLASSQNGFARAVEALALLPAEHGACP